MPARIGDTVSVDYTGRLEDGHVFDTSEGRAPLLFTLGAGDVLPLFEQAVIGLEPGQSTSVTIPAEDAYGEHIDDAVQVVPVDVFGESGPYVGAEFSVFGEDGTPFAGRVVAISDDSVNATLDFNHPLAGHALSFDITLAEIVETSAGTDVAAAEAGENA